MLVEPRATSNVFEQDPTLNVQNLERAIQTEIQVLEGQTVRQRVQADLGLESLPPEVNVSAVGSTDVVSVKVRSGDPVAARELADAYVQAYASVRREQARRRARRGRGRAAAEDRPARRADRGRPGGPARRAARPAEHVPPAARPAADRCGADDGWCVGVKSAEEPTDPVEPQPLRTAALAGVLGLLLGLGAAFLVDYIDDSVRSNEDLEGLTDVPVFAVVPVEPPPDNRPIAMSEPHEFAVEIYRGLRTNIQFLALDPPLRVLQVTSSLPGEGKTTTATNLAVVLAQAGHRVALVDADLRKPRIHEVFRVPPTPGFTELLLGEPLDMVVTHVEEGPDVVTAGTIPPNPSEMLSNERVAGHLRELAQRYDYVIVDTPPVLPVADALALSHAVDGVLLVAQANRVSRRQLTESLAKLERVGAPLFGFVLNRATGTSNEGGTYGYGYGYGTARHRLRPTPAHRAGTGPHRHALTALRPVRPAWLPTPARRGTPRVERLRRAGTSLVPGERQSSLTGGAAISLVVRAQGASGCLGRPRGPDRRCGPHRVAGRRSERRRER